MTTKQSKRLQDSLKDLIKICIRFCSVFQIIYATNISVEKEILSMKT